MVRMNFQIRWLREMHCHSKRSRGIPEINRTMISRDPSTPPAPAGFAQDDRACRHKKTRIEVSIRVLKYYPADAVQADHPFPFSNGWMTVAAASDFQSRPVILCDNPAS
jgi:hypothetical protein